MALNRSAFTPLSILAAKQPKPDQCTIPISKTTRQTLGRLIEPLTRVHPLFIDHLHQGDFVTKPIGINNLFGALSYLIFGIDDLRCVEAVEKFIMHHCKNEFATENVIVTAAYCLNTNIYVFREGVKIPVSKVSPLLLKQQSKEAYPGGLFLAFDLKTGSYQPVIAYNHGVVKDTETELRLRDKHGNLVTLTMREVQEHNLQKLKERFEYSGEIKTGLSKVALQRFAGFLRKPNVFHPMTHLDSELYAFALKYKIDHLRCVIRDAYLNEIHGQTLMRFLKENSKCDSTIVEHCFEVLQLMPIRELQKLSDVTPRAPEVTNRIETLLSFRKLVRNGLVAVDEPLVAIRLNMLYGTTFESEFYSNAWRDVPLNACLRKVFSSLHDSKQKHVVCSDTLIFVKNTSIGYIHLFKPYEEARYVAIPPGGPDECKIQLCLSSTNNVYLFDQESKLFAWIDDKYEISPWRKLRSDEWTSFTFSYFEVYDVRDFLCEDEMSMDTTQADSSDEMERFVSQTESGNKHAVMYGQNVFVCSVTDECDNKETEVRRNNLLQVTVVRYPNGVERGEDELNFDSQYSDIEYYDDEYFDGSVLFLVDANVFRCYIDSMK